MLQPVGNICPLPIVEFGNGGMETMLTAASYDRQIPVHRRMTYEQMLQAVEPCSVHVTEGVLPGDVSGVYDESVSTIVIDGSMTDVQKQSSQGVTSSQTDAMSRHNSLFATASISAFVGGALRPRR